MPSTLIPSLTIHQKLPYAENSIREVLIFRACENAFLLKYIWELGKLIPLL